MAPTSPTPPTCPSMTPDEIRNARFSTGFRGYDTTEVRAFLARVAGSYAELSARVFDVDRVTVMASDAGSGDATRIDVMSGEATDDDEDDDEDDDDAVTDEAALEAGRAHVAEMLAAARNESHAIVAKANDEAARIILRARAESRGKPSGDAMAVVEAAFADSPADPALAKEQARLMISEARAVRERILTDLAKRRKVAHVQLEQLRVAKERLQESLREARRVVDDASRDLGTAEIEARLAAETAGRRVSAEVEPTASELEAELFGAGSVLRSRLNVVRHEAVDAPPPVDATGDAVDAALDVATVDPVAVDEADVVAVDAVDAPDEPVAEAFAEAVVLPADELADSEHDDVPQPGAAAGKRPTTNVDDLFARLRADREQAVASAHEVLGTTTPAVTPDAAAPVAPIRTRKPVTDRPKGDGAGRRRTKADASAQPDDGTHATSSGVRGDTALIEVPDAPADPLSATDELVADDREHPSIDSIDSIDFIELAAFPSSPLDLRSLIGADANDGALVSVERVAADAGGADVQPEDERFEYVTGPLQGQLVRALRRELLDEQSSTLAALRTARGRVGLDELVGPEEAHRDRIVAAVRPFFADAYRAGSEPSRAGSDDFVAEVVRPFAVNVATVIITSVRSELAGGVEASSTPESDRSQLVDVIGTCYRSWTTDRMAALARDELVGCFGVGRER